MIAKVLFINPETGPLPRKRDDQMFVVAADNEALEAISEAALEARDSGPEGASTILTEMEHRGGVTYKFISLEATNSLVEGP